MIDKAVVDILECQGINIILSVPCNLLTGILEQIKGRRIAHVPVCREEEGIGIAAGAALAGKRPLVMMQNSGFGNCVNALMSLTAFYRLPLFMLMSHRGGPGEPISAQVPMGMAVPRLLQALNIDYISIQKQDTLGQLKPFIEETYEAGLIRAALLSRELWNETK